VLAACLQCLVSKSHAAVRIASAVVSPFCYGESSNYCLQEARKNTYTARMVILKYRSQTTSTLSALLCCCHAADILTLCSPLLPTVFMTALNFVHGCCDRQLCQLHAQHAAGQWRTAGLHSVAGSASGHSTHHTHTHPH
jgi:hypothetical protein